MTTRAANIFGALVMGVAVLLTPVSAAHAQGGGHVGDGFVNVQLGNVNILRNVSIAAAVAAVANVCPNVQNIALLAADVDQTGNPTTVCTGTTGPVSITQNTGRPGGQGGHGGPGGGHVGDGFVNVQLGNVNILRNVSIAAAVAAVANVCPNVQNVAVLAADVDQTGNPATACTGTTGPVTITQNTGRPGGQGN
jgi:hypothetical protein